ncbi:microtubule associated domain-containing protein [Rhizoctonia solani AG-1 IA]|uniref:Microtubule associated domain-containing protein n=1 Tax=Thanatephorus cucumeris (strain AG1-IA) TaxID=983506 RepID=L8WY51_THACA|nr:microtubule associated domain-containing protein [Rhizoctonia solani AG-1 IA]
MSARGRASRFKDASADASGLSLPHDVSFGSYQSSFASPGPPSRKPSGSAQTVSSNPSSAPIATPSPVPRRRSSIRTVTAQDENPGVSTPKGPPRINSFVLRDVDDSLDRLAEISGNGPDSPAPSPDKEKRTLLLDSTPGRTKLKDAKTAATDKGPTMTLREQEKLIDQVKRENFALKLKVHFLEERLNQLAPDHLEAALKQNISLKIEVQSQRVELKKHKKAATDAERAMAELRREMEASGSSSTALQEERARRIETERLLDERDRELRALRRRVGSGGSATGEVQDLRARNAQLEDELEEVRQALVETNEALERSGAAVVEELEDENAALRREAQAQLDALAQLGEERDDALEELDAIRLAHEQLIRRHESSLQDRSASRLQFEDERNEREALEEDVNALRDKLTATNIEMESRENEFRVLEAELRADMDERDAEWRQEMAELGSRVEELQDVEELREVRLRNEDLEENTTILHDQVETAFAHVENERNALINEKEDREAELEAANADIAAQGKRIYELEEALEAAQAAEAEARQEREVEMQVVVALKEKLSTAKNELRSLQTSYTALEDQLAAQRERETEMSRRDDLIAEEMEDLRAIREELEAEKRALEDDLMRTEDKWEKERADREREGKIWAGRLEDAERLQARAVDELEHVSQQLRSVELTLAQRDADLAAVQAALRSLETARENSTTDKFSMELELDRLRRDLERCEDELARARRELADAESRGREREHAEKRDLETQLAVQRQTRLNLSEKLDAAQANLKTIETDAASHKLRITELESRLSKDQRSHATTEAQYREQITERNTLLLTICKYIDQVLGADKVRRNGDGKPFTNFSVFHDRILERLRSLTMINTEFVKQQVLGWILIDEQGAEQGIGCPHEGTGQIRSELEDGRRGKARVAKETWGKRRRTRCASSTSPTYPAFSRHSLTLIQAHNDELTIQLRQLRRASSGEGVLASTEIKSLSARAQNAERRLQNAQNLLAAAEERFTQQSERNSGSEMRWEARVKEYEGRVRAAEEKVKRERQGAKERTTELENAIRCVFNDLLIGYYLMARDRSLERQLEREKKRSAQLSDMNDLNKVNPGSS